MAERELVLIFQRELPHSMLEIRPSEIIVHPHAPQSQRYRQDLSRDTVPAMDVLVFHVRTANSAWIRAFTEDSAPLIARIQRALRLPPEEAPDDIHPAALEMVVFAEQRGI